MGLPEKAIPVTALASVVEETAVRSIFSGLSYYRTTHHKTGLLVCTGAWYKTKHESQLTRDIKSDFPKFGNRPYLGLQNSGIILCNISFAKARDYTEYTLS